jgi:hypothetical protein
MYKVIKKYQKNLMAVFAVLLMVSFVATIGVGRAGNAGSRSDPVVAHLGKDPVRDSEMRAARDEWTFLQQGPVSHDFMGQEISLVTRALSPQIAADIEKHPELFLLLRKEAERDGMSITPEQADMADSLVVNQFHHSMDSEEGKRGSRALKSLLLIRAELNHLGESIKVSEPVWQHQVAEQQSIRLNLVDLRTGDFEKSIPAPTTQQAQEQFDKYKDLPADQPSQENPLGFGYQIPTRVKIQYIEVPRAQVIDAVIHHTAPPSAVGTPGSSADTQYDWEVQAALYYDAHKDEYLNPPPPASQPATTEPSSQPSTTQASSQPIFKPFDEVKRQIVEKLAAPEADKLSTKITDEVKSRLQDAYAAVRHANPLATQPTTEPSATSQPAGAPTSFALLEQIRSDIEKKYQVAIQLHDIGSDWQDDKQLAKLPGIGSAATPDGVPFPEYATSFAHPLGAVAIPPSIWESSQTLTDVKQNAYVFRLTAAQPAHAPPSIADVRSQLDADCKTAQAYAQAKQAAQKIVESARTLGLSQAARLANQRVTSTPLFSPQQESEIPGYPLQNSSAARELLDAVGELPRIASPSDPHPDKLIELPTARRVVVAELGGVQLPVAIEQAKLRAVQRERQTWLEQLADEWFSYPSVVSRLDYKPVEKS